MTTIAAPWTPGQVESLRAWQAAAHVPHFTCGVCRDRDVEAEIAGGDRVLDERALVPTVDGWVCPTCAYTQNWAHDFMLNKKLPPNPFDLFRNVSETTDE